MSGIHRRAFLRAALAAAGGLSVPRVVARAATAGGTAVPAPGAPTAWRKHGVVLAPSEPWEAGGVQSFTSPAEPLADGAWRLWYTVTGRKAGTLAFAEGVPGQPLRKFRAECSAGEPAAAPFAIGNLPDQWMPQQVVHVRLPNGKHRIYFWAHGPQIKRYLAADSDDGRRYRVVNPLRPVLYHPNDRAAQGVPSPDGVMLRRQRNPDRPRDEPLADPRLISNDATTVYALPGGGFEMYSVGLVPVPKEDPAYMPHDNAPGLLRVIDRYTSEDGLHFGTRRRVIERDAADPVDQQFYYLSVTRTPRGCVGMLGHYRCAAQTMDLEWCYSADGVTWQRPHRRAWLPRGEPPDVDSYGIYANSHLVEHDGRWHLFYTGVNTAHNGKDAHGKPQQVILHATTDSLWA